MDDFWTIRIPSSSILCPHFRGKDNALIGSLMFRTVHHVERKSRFLRSILPCYPRCEEVRFGLLDYAAIGVTLACFIGMARILAG